MESMLKLSIRALSATWDLYSNAKGVSISISENLKETFDKITQKLEEATEQLSELVDTVDASKLASACVERTTATRKISHVGECSIIDGYSHCLADSNNDSKDSNCHSAETTTATSTSKSSRIEAQVYATALEAYKLSKELQTDPSLLPQIHFPIEQRVAVYAPYWIPLFIPLLRAIFKSKDKTA